MNFPELHNQWISFSTIVSLFGLLALYGSAFVPNALQRVFRYGKTANDENQPNKPNLISIPKKSAKHHLCPLLTPVSIHRWFFHFYVFATLFYAALLVIVLRVYLFRQSVPKLLALTLDTVVGRHRRSSVSPESVLVAMCLLQLQVSRRLYECTQLSVYARDGKMALIHYLCGFSFYFGVGLSLLAEASGFQSTNGSSRDLILRNLCLPNHVIGVSLFLFFSFVQFKSHVILAELRKDSKGRVVTYGHSIPNGHWFEYVSCPHYLAEILIYLCLSLVLSGRSSYWWLVCSFVVANQVVVGLFNHKWYLQHFHNYPKHRKAVFPFVL
ncbi:unnamed protein product [Medioppia subpectinata]|uniref:Polyprenal reductase n=1 Tax=Medioppia subpectinata TaxID=1979941 RepID=A0A7R9L2J5_9ACAR|nr:unnamed protein product [Medioppia subpectinata]CAG2114371.1 unnamed protein product [Medioppia subpectinata]